MAGLSVYVVGSFTASAAIILVSDVFGKIAWNLTLFFSLHLLWFFFVDPVSGGSAWLQTQLILD
jgi:hypothetical protein